MSWLRCSSIGGCIIEILCLLQPDTVTGDIVFVLQLKEHPKFKRKGDDLFVEHSLSLTKALCGFHFPVTHLDGRQLLIKSAPGEIIKPGVLSAVQSDWVGRLLASVGKRVNDMLLRAAAE